MRRTEIIAAAQTGWAPAPRTVLADATLAPAARLVYIVLIGMLRPTEDRVSIRYAILAQACGLTLSTLKRALESLERAGYLTRRPDGRNVTLEPRIPAGQREATGSNLTPIEEDQGQPEPDNESNLNPVGGNQVQPEPNNEANMTPDADDRGQNEPSPGSTWTPTIRKSRLLSNKQPPQPPTADGHDPHASPSPPSGGDISCPERPTAEADIGTRTLAETKASVNAAHVAWNGRPMPANWSRDVEREYHTGDSPGLLEITAEAITAGEKHRQHTGLGLLTVALVVGSMNRHRRRRQDIDEAQKREASNRQAQAARAVAHRDAQRAKTATELEKFAALPAALQDEYRTKGNDTPYPPSPQNLDRRAAHLADQAGAFDSLCEVTT